MSSESPVSAPTETGPRLPLFYRDPQPLNATIHANWRLKSGDAGFAREAPYVPIVAGELAAASRSYPVVFAADSAQPVAVLGLERGANLFVEDGRWSLDTHIPAYVRRYPFGFIATTDPDGFMLAIDAGSDRVARDGVEGEPLFADGQPSKLTKEALEFCAAFGREVELTRLFTDALREKELLIDRRVDATLPNGRALGLDGFQIIDAEKFSALDDETVLAWHRQGMLALVHHHLASLDRFRALLDRQALRAAAGLSPSDAPNKAADADADASDKSTRTAKTKKVPA